MLFADDRGLVVDSSEKLPELESEYGRVCERKKLGVNVNKSMFNDFSRGRQRLVGV